MAFPFASQRFVVEALYQPQTCWARGSNDILPLFVPLEDFDREALNTASHSAVFVNLPHSQIVLYYLWYVKQAGR